MSSSRATSDQFETVTSLKDVMESDYDGRTVRVTQRWPRQDELEAMKKYIVSYLFISDQSPPDIPTLVSPSLEVVAVDKSNRQRTIDYMVENYYSRFKGEYSQSDVDQFLSKAEEYFALEVTGKLYLKDDTIVGCLLANRFEQFSILDRPTIHIGYWGLEVEILTDFERKCIKSDWVNTLKQLKRDGDVVDGFVAAFNERCLGYAAKLGTKIVGMRFDRIGQSKESA